MKTEEEIRDALAELDIDEEVRRDLIDKGCPDIVDLIESKINTAKQDILKWVLW